MFKQCKKEDLRLIAVELGEEISDKITVVQLIELIKANQYFNDNEFITDLINSTVEERKIKEHKIKEQKLLDSEKNSVEIEKIKLERVKAELELAKVKAVSNSEDNSEKESDSKESLDSLIKSIRTLTVKVPSVPEGWSYFFASLERAYSSKNVPEKFKAEILLNLLGEKACNVITYIKDDELNNYDQIKAIVLREFEPTPLSCLLSFRNAVRKSNETYTQFASRLITSWEYYLKLRKVTEFKDLNDLIVSDKLFQTLEKDVSSHISVRQADNWFKPVQLGKEIDLYYTSSGKNPKFISNSNQKGFIERNTSKVFLCESKKCFLCKENHPLYKCPNYKKLSVTERVECVKNNNLCFNCLNSHKVSSCKSRYSCNICKRRHHDSLHFPSEKKQSSKYQNDDSSGARHLSAEANEFIPAAINQTNDKYFAATSNYLSENQKTVLLSTFICFLSNEKGEFIPVRGLLDVGANSNFLSRKCAERLNLKKNKINISVSGLSGLSLTIKSKVNATITNEDKNFKLNLDFLIVPRITDLTPSKKLDICVPELDIIKLADKKFNIPGSIDLLLGAENFYEILKPGQIYPSNTKLIFQNTVFGYVASGSVISNSDNKVHCGLMSDNVDLNKTIEKFWEIENIDVNIPKNKESVICETHFQNNCRRDKTGRYVVRMPLKEDPSCLGYSRDIALKKLNSLRSRLDKNPDYSAQYSAFLHEYCKLGHMTEINESEEQKGSYYIPHLGVYRGVEKSSSTPLRVVFNASSLTTKGKSLNSIQFNGGVIQDDLFSIMVRFRKHIFAFTADIMKMYRMILIDPDQRKLQKILWRESFNEPVKTYELNTVTYGTVSAPFLAMRTLKQLAKDEGKDFPLAESVLENDLYMDDVLSGSESLSEAKDLQQQLIKILQCGGMSLHKWCSNNCELAMNNDSIYSFTNPEESSALGVVWKPKKDCLCFKLKYQKDLAITKRHVLSTIARIFDPVGLLGPIIAKAKIFMQRLWLIKLDWGENLPEKEVEEWHKFYNALQSINDLEIERCIVIPEAIAVELHGFCDASEAAYGAVIYCKSQSRLNDLSVKLVASKSRVSPLKKITIPRLELNAAVLLAQLMTRVRSALKMNVNDIFLWSDSMIVLCWLKKEPYLLKTFVSNRVATIQELTSVKQWRHVPTSENPADLISRGVDPNRLSNCELWWKGPQFLTENEYPSKEIVDINFEDELKLSKNFQCYLNFERETFINDFINLSNNYTKLLHILSFIFRFIWNSRKKEKRSNTLSTNEIQMAETTLIKLVQGNEFQNEINSISKNGKVSDNCKIKNLLPFLDEKGVLRVRGRLANSDILNYDKKFPIILPKNHKLTKLIVLMYHKKYLHVGPQALLFLIRQKYWPVEGRNICRKTVHECVVCFKAKPKVCNQVMGQLPKERISPNFPFNCVGVDFCGPFFIKYPNQRKGLFYKVYISIFVCFVTKACHLELVTDLTSDAFIATLKRFFNRRGKCAQLFSDNATNFVGSNLELKRLGKLVNQPDLILSNFLSSENVEWNFIPPRAPNYGGLWEAGVKSVKYHLKRVVGNLKLTYEEFLTIIVQIEGIMNSRPLYPLSTALDDFDVLTPGHFLIGRPITTISEPNVISVADNRLKSWQKLTKIVQGIWKKWKNNYLSTLQERNKWYFIKDNVNVGDMVVLKEDNIPVCNWPLGRIVDVIKGKDNLVRVVVIKTKNGEYKRPISKICILPMPDKI